MAKGDINRIQIYDGQHVYCASSKRDIQKIKPASHGNLCKGKPPLQDTKPEAQLLDTVVITMMQPVARKICTLRVPTSPSGLPAHTKHRTRHAGITHILLSTRPAPVVVQTTHSHCKRSEKPTQRRANCKCIRAQHNPVQNFKHLQESNHSRTSR